MVRTAIKIHGGKRYLADKIVALMPPHKHYLEAFAGGLSVLLAKPCEGVSEVANDLNDELVNFWRVLRETPDSILRALLCTPVSQVMFDEAKRVAQYDDVKRAVAFFVRARQSRQGLGRDYCTPTSRLRRGMNEHVSAWWSAIDGLPEIADRLSRVEIWRMPAVEAIQIMDSPDTVHYVDPPYVHGTRTTKTEYGVWEMRDEQHRELHDVLSGVKGKFLLSGYKCDLYLEAEKKFGWKRVEFDVPNNASGSRKKQRKIECVWMNY